MGARNVNSAPKFFLNGVSNAKFEAFLMIFRKKISNIFPTAHSSS